MNNFISSEDSFKIEKAISFLIENYNKSGKNPKPVILHSIRVGMYLLESGYETDIVVVGILHDLIEDSDVTIDDIKNNFSQEIASWVESVSFKPQINDTVEQYKEMFARTILEGRIPVVVKAADILANSLYIHLVTETEKQKFLIDKIKYFLDVSQSFSSEPIVRELKNKYEEGRY